MAEQSATASPNFADYQAFLWRDLVIVTITAILWFANSIAPLSGAAGYACGVLTGICALQLHEWGHVWGAFRCRADLYPPAHWWHPFMFSLDHTSNSRAQFLAVSLPAFAATAVYLTGFLTLLPRDTLAGKTALIMGLVTASLTVLIELPLFAKVYRGGKLPPVELFKRPQQGR